MYCSSHVNLYSSQTNQDPTTHGHMTNRILTHPHTHKRSHSSTSDQPLISQLHTTHTHRNNLKSNTVCLILSKLYQLRFEEKKMFISKYGVFSFIHCNYRFFIGKGGGAAAKGGLEIRHDQQPSQVILLWTSFPWMIASRTCLPDRFWDILDTWPNQCSWGLSIRRSSSIFRALRISQLRTLSQIVKPWTLRKFAISAACTWDSVLHSVITQDSLQ